jgi:predicted urease superfamily metal-dependent hydrolase
MRLEEVRSQRVQVSLHPLELAGLITAARWVLTGLRDTPPPEALEQLRRILADYDRQAAGLAGRPHRWASDQTDTTDHAGTIDGAADR